MNKQINVGFDVFQLHVFNEVFGCAALRFQASSVELAPSLDAGLTSLLAFNWNPYFSSVVIIIGVVLCLQLIGV